MFVDTLNLSHGWMILFWFYEWTAKQSGFLDEASFAAVANFLGLRKDFKAMRILLPIGMKTSHIVVDRLARLVEQRSSSPSSMSSTSSVSKLTTETPFSFNVSALFEHSFAGHSESLMKKTTDQLFPGDAICEILVKGWFIVGKLDEARRLAGRSLVEVWSWVQ